MIDFLKMRLDPSLEEQLLSNPLLDFKRPISELTGEIFYPQVARYENLIFEFKSKDFILLSGSIHKYWQDNRNYKDFYYTDLCNAVDDICNKFDIDPKQARINNIEYGVNLQNLPIRTYKILDNLLRYSTNSFNPMRNNKHIPLSGKDCAMNQFTIKVYDKAKQYHLEHQICRIEVKVKKMEHLFKKKIFIHTLDDLVDKSYLNMLGEDLENTWNKILMFDTNLKKLKVTKVESAKLKDYGNLAYWERLHRISPKSHNYHRDRMRYLINLLPNPIQGQIGKMINTKWLELSNFEHQELAKMTNFKKHEFSQNDRSSSRSFWTKRM
ncbi:hypothetical protein WJR50_21580 [Catalinimonas sp. 4WD22]|uniref:hypothetical protein n=1 Tax=Catalinimonas locisalis TaxID=3133978 RepID=UPI00310154D0